MKYQNVLNESLYDELCVLLKKVDKNHTLNLVVENGADVKIYNISENLDVALSKSIIKIKTDDFLVVIPIEKIISCVFFDK